MYGSYRFRQSGDGNCWQDYKRREQKKTDVIQFWRNDIINFGFDVVSRVVSGSLVCKLDSSRESALTASIFVLAVHWFVLTFGSILCRYQFYCVVVLFGIGTGIFQSCSTAMAFLSLPFASTNIQVITDKHRAGADGVFRM
jgi:hypothetical protein